MITSVEKLYTTFCDGFSYRPTSKQKSLFLQMANYALDDQRKSVFIIKGFAGTGKTSSISSIVNNLWKAGVNVVLLAPTGRAAKILGGYSKKKAYTIHKKIYRARVNSLSGLSFVRQPNKYQNTLFFVDEASLISSNNSSLCSDNSSLLDDLIEYVYSGYKCKLVCIGDTAQLPPVNSHISPALDVKNIESIYDKEVTTLLLDQVTRHQESSGVLLNATRLRELITMGTKENFKFANGFPDIIPLFDSCDIQDAIAESYKNYGESQTAFIVRSNKRANQYNKKIREYILGYDNEINKGDHIMVVKNNYYWLDQKNDVGFIANGDTFEILEVYNSCIEIYDFRFARVRVKMLDYEDMPPFDVVIMLDTLGMNQPSLSYEKTKELYQKISEDFQELPKYKQLQKIKKNEYYNALVVKFSYAMTCHKSQGGQWPVVFVEKPFLFEGENTAYYRWLYTAITRVKDKLYLIGFKSDEFS